MTKYILSFISIIALSTATYAGSCCSGPSKDKDSEGETTSLIQVLESSVASCCTKSCDGDKADEDTTA